MALSFQNTEIAFGHKSVGDLRKARSLFKAFSYPLLVNHGPKLASMAISIGFPIKGVIKNTLFHQFCGGETIEESLPSAKELFQNNIGAILDYSVEGEGNEDNYKACFEELQRVIRYAAKHEEFPFAVFKCSGIADIDMLENPDKASYEYKQFRERFTGLCDLASQNNVQLLVDAEETWIQDAIDEITYEMMVKYNAEKAIIFNTIQCYRTGRVEHIRQQFRQATDKGYKLGLKLVRGAYMEKERERADSFGYTSPIQTTKSGSDNEYNQALEVCMANINSVTVMAGTHNEESSLLLTKLMSDSNISPSDPRVWFAQLYGMSDHISFNLAKAGFNVGKYLPYGPVKEVLPYLSRRAKENSSVKGQAGRELSLINQEIKRRRTLAQ